MKRSGRKRLSVEIPIALHTELRKIAVSHGCTITVVVWRYLVEKVLVEKKLNETPDNTSDKGNELTDLFMY